MYNECVFQSIKPYTVCIMFFINLNRYLINASSLQAVSSMISEYSLITIVVLVPHQTSVRGPMCRIHLWNEGRKTSAKGIQFQDTDVGKTASQADLIRTVGLADNRYFVAYTGDWLSHTEEEKQHFNLSAAKMCVLLEVSEWSWSEYSGKYTFCVFSFQHRWKNKHQQIWMQNMFVLKSAVSMYD